MGGGFKILEHIAPIPSTKVPLLLNQGANFSINRFVGIENFFGALLIFLKIEAYS